MPIAISAHMSMNTNCPSHMNDSRENAPSASVARGISRKREISRPKPVSEAIRIMPTRNPPRPNGRCQSSLAANECTEKSASTPLRVRNDAYRTSV